MMKVSLFFIMITKFVLRILFQSYHFKVIYLKVSQSGVGIWRQS